MNLGKEPFSGIAIDAKLIDSRLSELCQSIAFCDFEKAINQEARLYPLKMLQYIDEKTKMLEESKFAIAALDDSKKKKLIHILNTDGTARAFNYVEWCTKRQQTQSTTFPGTSAK